MAVDVAPTATAIYTKLRALLLEVVPDGVQVVRGMSNRTSMPPADPGFINMTLVLQSRLRTNVRTYIDPVFTPGEVNAEQGTKITVQLDCYGASSSAWAAAISTLMRSEFACDALAPECAPLHADDPRLAPLINAEKEYEQRWIVGAVLQANFTASTPMEFADTLTLDLQEIDEAYPP